MQLTPRIRTKRFILRLALLLLSTHVTGHMGNAQTSDSAEVTRWIKSVATVIRPDQASYGRFEDEAAGVQVLGLGEATHGQHEAFELKRRLTMHFIRKHGFRIVAYEASASRAVDCDDYIAGRTDDRDKAISGLGMLIWQVEENGRLLDDLRAWNASAAEEDQVRFIGCDAQSGKVIVSRLGQSLGEANSSVMVQLEALLGRSEPAVRSAHRGDRAELLKLLADANSAAHEIRHLAGEQSLNTTEIDLRLNEFVAHLGLYGDLGARDKAMAELLLDQLKLFPTDKCIFWGHNAHVQRTPLTHMGSDALAMGGHLAESLGTQYYALGFFFGTGEFQANVLDESGKWRFRRYEHSAAPDGSLDAFLRDANSGDFLLDFRCAPASGPVPAWLRSQQGHRWWGGYNVPDDFDQRTSQAEHLSQCAPGEAYDGLAFLRRTSAARPVNESLIISE